METVKVNKSRTKREMNYMVEKKCFQLDETCRDRIEKLKSELVSRILDDLEIIPLCDCLWLCRIS